MSDQIQASIVRILAASNTIAGAGVLVSEKHVLTCAHVVAQSLGISQETSETPAGEIHLDFPLIAPGKLVTAKVVGWWAVHSFGPAELASAEDIAVLELQEGNSSGGPLPARIVPADNLWGHHFRTYGFPAGHDDGVWASGVLRERQASGWVQVEDLKETGFRVEPGFSGTPVWDEQLGGVVGIVVVSARRLETKAAFIIPTDVLLAVWPTLSVQPTDPFRKYVEQLKQRIDEELKAFICLPGTLKLQTVDTPDAASPILGISLKPTRPSWSSGAATEVALREFAGFPEAFLHYRKRMLLLGDPGAGKSTTLRLLARETIVQRLANPKGLLPVYGDIHTWNGKMSLIDWLAWANELDADQLRREISTKRALLMLDGLDELRRNVVDLKNPTGSPHDYELNLCRR